MSEHNRTVRIASVMVICLVGLVWAASSQAASYAANAQAESAQIQGRASVVSNNAGSGGQAVRFGVSPAQSSIPGLDTAMTNFMSKYGIPGMSIAVSRADKLVYARSYGTIGGGSSTLTTNNSRYRIASVSKPITAVTIFKLIEEGRVTMDTPVFGPNGVLGKSYPSVSSVHNTITIRNLLQHTTGVWANGSNDPTYAHPEYTQRQLIEWTLATYPANVNRGKYAYSNFGYLLLGRVIESLTGQAYETYVRNQVLAPMGITDMQIGGSKLAERKPNEVIYVGKDGADPYGANLIIPRRDSHGGWIASATDLVRFAVRINGHSGKSDFLKAATIAAMVTPSAANANYASGWSVNSANNWWHTGALPGTSSELVRASNGMTWAILANTFSYDANYVNEMDQLIWPFARDNAVWQDIDQF